MSISSKEAFLELAKLQAIKKGSLTNEYHSHIGF